jgi:hypothetical protein
MLWTLYAMRSALNLYEGGTKIKTSPSMWLIDPLVVAGTVSVAERTIILVPFISPGMYPEVAYAVLVKIEVCIFYNCMLDI